MLVALIDGTLFRLNGMLSNPIAPQITVLAPSLYEHHATSPYQYKFVLFWHLSGLDSLLRAEGLDA